MIIKILLDTYFSSQHYWLIYNEWVSILQMSYKICEWTTSYIEWDSLITCNNIG